MKDETIAWVGKKLPEYVERDAIHIAVLPVVLGPPVLDIYLSGDPVRFIGDSTILVTQCDEHDSNSIGIIDPFIKEPPKEGDRVFVFMYPGTITGLRHQWSHPMVNDDTTPRSDLSALRRVSELWLREFAARWCFDYDELIRDAASSGHRVLCAGRDMYGDLSDSEKAMFWNHLSLVVGKVIDEEHREATIWRCAC